MKYILRPYIAIALGLILGAASGAGAQSTRISQILEKVDPLLTRSSAGYLGVLVSDVDNDSATKLKLKETRGALITLIDHDAPAGQAGLRVNDVVLEINSQRVEGAEQFGRMLREIPAGRKVNLLVSRDGSPQKMEVQLCDRKVMEQDVWNKLGRQADGGSSAPTKGILTGNGDAGSIGFHMPFFGSSLNVGAMVEPLNPQTADVLGVPSGVLVKQVARKSEAAAAGFKEHDVILKVGNELIKTTADWDRALRANQDKPVQVTILRDGKQQVLNLQVDSKRNKGGVDLENVFPGLLPDGPSELVAWLDPAWEADAQAAADQMRAAMEAFDKNFNSGDFKLDPKAMEKFQQGMEEFSKQFNAGSFGLDQKQMDEFKREMEQMRQSMPEFFQLNRQQLDQLRRNLQELRTELSHQV
jgi:serine protease Do